jgi:hypothetical protein
VRLVGLDQLKKSNNLIGNRTRDLLARSIVPRPTTLSRGPILALIHLKIARGPYFMRFSVSILKQCQGESVIKLRVMGWAGRLAREVIRNTKKILVRESEGRKHLRRPICMGE